MPSGNAIYTYTGPEESTEIQGQIFLKDQPKHITDKGVIAVCAVREDFKSGGVHSESAHAGRDLNGESAQANTDAPTDADGRRTLIREDSQVSNPAKPKKAKSK